MKIGQLVVKTAGRESNRDAVIVDIVNDSFVLIDGNVKRRKCNIKHLEPLDATLKINKNASTEEVHKAMKTANINIIEKKPPKEAKPQQKEPKDKQDKTKKSKKKNE